MKQLLENAEKSFVNDNEALLDIARTCWRTSTSTNRLARHCGQRHAEGEDDEVVEMQQKRADDFMMSMPSVGKPFVVQWLPTPLPPAATTAPDALGSVAPLLKQFPQRDASYTRTRWRTRWGCRSRPRCGAEVDAPLYTVMLHPEGLQRGQSAFFFFFGHRGAPLSTLFLERLCAVID